MALFKKTRNGQKGGPWIARYRDGAGIVRERSTGCRDKTAAQSVLTEWARDAERQRAGLLTAQEATAATWANDSLDKHSEAYQEHLRAGGVTERHIAYRKRELEKVFKECGWHRLRDLNRDGFERWINLQAKAGLSARRRNNYHDAVCGFARWGLESGRLTLFPFNGLRKANQAADRRLIRRALTPEELSKLIEAAEARPVSEALTHGGGPRKGEAKQNVSPLALEKARRLGRERGMFYRLLGYTGLRAGEARALQVGDLELETESPFIRLRAATEKNRKGATVPLRADLAADLALYLSERRSWLVADSVKRGSPTLSPLGMEALVFQKPPVNVRTFDLDLVAAGLATRDKDGKIHKADDRGRTVDIHSLRGTFASMLAASGVPLATAQVLMRHSTPALTAKHYLDPRMLDCTGAVESLPASPRLLGWNRCKPPQVVNLGGEKRPLQRPLSLGKRGQNGALSDTTRKGEKTRAIQKTQCLQGFLMAEETSTKIHS